MDWLYQRSINTDIYPHIGGIDIILGRWGL